MNAKGTSSTAAALLGGTLAATSHFAKATTRAAVNTSPEPFSNIGLSLAGDAAVPTALWLAWAHPWAFFGVLALALALMGVLLWKFGGSWVSCCGGSPAAQAAACLRPDGPQLTAFAAPKGRSRLGAARRSTEFNDGIGRSRPALEAGVVRPPGGRWAGPGHRAAAPGPNGCLRR